MFVFCLSKLWEQMFDFRKHIGPHRVWFRVFKVVRKVWVLKQIQSTILSRVCHMTILSTIIRVMNIGHQTSWATVTASCPFGDWSSKFVTDQRMSGLLIRVKYDYFSTIYEYKLDSSPTISISYFLTFWLSKQGVETLYNCSVFLFVNSHYLLTHFFSHVLPYHRTRRDTQIFRVW